MDLLLSAQAEQNIWADVAILGTGGAVLAVWLVTHRGPARLRQAPPRPHRLPPVTPLALIGAWMLFNLGLFALLEGFVDPPGRRIFLQYLALDIGYALFCGMMLILAQRSFVHGLTGFGIRWRTLGRDLVWAFVNLLAAWPLIYLAVAAVVFFGQQVGGDEFQFEQNTGLVDIQQSVQMPPHVLAAVLVFTLLLVPLFEEILFRGLLQSAIRNLTGSPWSAIFLTSIPFALLHPLTHLPALLVLSICLGYAYERSGSLLRSIFIHALFNAINVGVTLTS
ncbi:MAG TPA: CPBP family intramembrane metalloprotease [Phycisphaerales bacterium]|nr:CPBP family intramembrane metalloprotease [Phycisphaerales bacterium]